MSSPAEMLQAQRAMRQHESQYVWFRRLYVVFSRYMAFNTFRYMDQAHATGAQGQGSSR